MLNEKNKTVIVLNGTSSAGKSSIAKALKKEFLAQDNLFLHFQMDTIWDMLPEGVKGSRLENKVPIIFGSAKALTDNGHNVVMDIVCPAGPIDTIKDKFNNCNVVLVGVYANIETLKQREIERGNRDIGLAESQSGENGINKDIIYDVTVDTSNKTAESSAQYIIASL